MNIDVSSLIAWWGAGLSTLLALVKLYEFWRDRFRVEIGHGFTGDINHGNDIHIRNLSSRPIILSYWELFYRKSYWSSKHDKYIASPEAFAYDLKIDPHSSYTLNFNGQDHFSWGKAEDFKIYMRLHIAGRRPIVKKVYG